MKLQDWTAAAEVLDGFRAAFPEHELNNEATKQLAFVYREGGETSLAAAEYERVAAEAADPELKREALLSAGELYEQASDVDSALGVYERYVAEFAQPVDVAIETRSKVAEMYRARGDEARYHEHLAALVAADAAAGARAHGSHALSRRAGRARPRAAALRGVQRRAARPAVRAEPRAQARAHGRGARRVREPHRVRGRRGHDGRHVPHGRDLLELQPFAARFRAARGPLGRRARGVRGRARGRGVPVRRARDRGPRSERRGHDRGRHLQPLDRAELRSPRGARARALREGRAEHRAARRDRDVHVPLAGRAGAGEHRAGGRRARGPPCPCADKRTDDRARRARRRRLHDHGCSAREPGAARPLLGSDRLSRARLVRARRRGAAKP